MPSVPEHFSGLEKRSSRLVHSQETAGSSPAPASSWPGLNEGLGLKLNAISHPSGFGLAPLKTEGEPLPYDPGAGPGVPLTRWGRIRHRLGEVGRRLRYLPTRLWWAVFGDEYY